MDDNSTIDNTIVEKIPKKRGRKKKEVQSDNVETKVLEKKKRGRKKKWEIETTTKVLNHTPIIFTEKLVDKPNDEIHTDKYDQEHVLFGNLNIKLHTNKDTINYDSIKNSLKQKTNNRINLTASDLDSDSSHEDEEENLLKYEYSENYDIIKKSNDKQEIKKKNDKKQKNNIETKKYPVKNIKCMKFFSDDFDSGKEILLSNIRCYNCHHNFNTQPFFLPTDYCVSTKRYKVTGNFCSPNCVKSYALNSKTLNSKAYLVGEMYRKLLGQTELIKPAPPIQVLKEYGGTMTISEYRKSFHEQQTYNLLPICSKIIYQDVIIK